ncbi:MAG: ATP-grasp domain-containing protein [Candidatus Marinimicrobia bacterium]|jgi:biotin carboxylase|nr:ATP-grasp domain-containing protein [Candidatus Neomarinimicrobiota bacterium]MBT6937163.1 ATP-grasp domain-containing protein [Candidatus Neomarinimicrobiota bacterium]
MKKKKVLLIIGAGIEQVYAYQLAKKMGLIVIGLDINPNAPSLPLADHYISASTRNISESVKCAVSFNEKIKINGVMTLANDVPLTVAKVSRALGLPSLQIKSAEIVSDKLKMKECFEANGVPTAPFKKIYSYKDIDTLIKLWGYPIVIKPNDGRGARGVLRITKEIDKQWAFNHSINSSENNWVLAEKYIEGMQLSTESIIYEENCYTASISHRNYDLINIYSPFIIENGGVLPADLKEEEFNLIEQTIKKAANALGLVNGTIKGDFILTKDGPIVIECALRLSGGYLCTDQIPLARGVDLVKQTIKLSLGQKLNLKDLIPQDIHKMGIRYFFPKPGKITSIRGFNELDQYDWITKKKLSVKVGDLVYSPQNHTQRVGFVHTIGKTFFEAEQRAIFATKRVIIDTI